VVGITSGKSRRRVGFWWFLLGCGVALAACEGDDANPATPGDAGESAGGGDTASAGSSTTAGSDAGGSDAGGAASSGGAPSNEGPEGFLPLYENGSRLRAISLGEPDSTTRRLIAWYDSELETECSFAIAEDGKTRCLPRPQTLAKGFADAECTQVVYYDTLVSPCGTHPGFRHEPVELDGCSGVRVLRMQPESLDSVFHESCPAEPSELGSAATAWSDVEAIDPSELVEGVPRERVNASGFGVVELVTADGARQVTGIFDERYGACTSRDVADGGVRCLPPYAFRDSPWWFQDDACSGEPLAYGIRGTSCGEATEFSIALDIYDRDGEAPLVVSLGAEAAGAVYEKSFSSEACDERAAADVLWALYPVGEPFDTEQLLPLTEMAHGSGRVRTWLHAVDSVLLNYVPGDNGAFMMFDSDGNEACTARRLAGGDWTCLTSATSLAELYYYTDADCQTPVVQASAGATHFALTQRNFCVRESFADEVVEIHELGTAYSGDLYTQVGAGDCTPSAQQATGDFFELGPAALDTVPLLVELTE
jgi:hypothetical protein